MPKTIEGVEIFAVGTWNGFKFSREDLEEIAANTRGLMQRNRHKPPLKLGHDPDQSLLGQVDGDPALGWIENVRAQGDKLLADFVDVPDIVVRAMEGALFRQVSAEMQHIDPMGWMLTAVALLGADLPAVKTLEDLQVYLSERSEAGLAGEVQAACFSSTEPWIKRAKADLNEREPLERELNALRQFKDQSLRDQADKDGEIRRLRQQAKTRVFAAAKEKALAPFEEEVRAGQLAPALRDEIAAALDRQAAGFGEGAELSLPLALCQRLAGERLPREARAFADAGAPEAQTGDGRIDEELVMTIHRLRAQNPDLGFTDAADHVFRTHPELARRYRDESIHMAREMGQ